MASQAVPRKVRKGTKSCSECRRRKLRCSWSSENADACRRCEERGIICIAQVYSTQSTSRKSTTRDRVSRLEQQVLGLAESLRTVEQKIGCSTSSILDAPASPSIPHEAVSDSEDTGDGDSNLSRSPLPTKPHYLNSLFNNDLISSEAKSGTPLEKLRSGKDTQAIQDRARKILQPLIPPREQISDITGYSVGWLALLRALFPTTTPARSGDELILQYDDMMKPTVNPCQLATWLLSIAITAEQIPETRDSSTSASRLQNYSTRYSKAVSAAVEKAILSQISIVATLEGLEAALFLLRLYLTQGHFTKGWLGLRHIIAIAELTGISKTTKKPLATLWETICSLERFNCMVFAYPTSTQRYRRLFTEPLVDEHGKVVATAYLSRLSQVAMEIENVSNMQTTMISDDSLPMAIANLDHQLEDLAAQAPPYWWTDSADLALVDRLMQHFHHYVRMRVHLPLLLRPELATWFSSIRSTGINACFAVARSFLAFCPLMPYGFFIRNLFDIQVFTAIVTLLLTANSSGPQGQPNPALSRAAKDIVLKVVDVMESMRHHPSNHIARLAVDTVRTLMKLFSSQDSPSATPSDGTLALSVPLLGTIYARRKPQETMVEPQQQGSAGVEPSQNVTSSVGDGIFGGTDPAFWGGVSFSVEENFGPVPHDVLMREDLGSTDLWAGDSLFNFDQV